TFGEVETVANCASDAVEVNPLQVRLVHAALVDQILDQAAHGVVRQCSDDRGVHAKASLQAARDVVLTATLPNLEVTRGRNASLARIEPQHHLAEAHNVPATLRLWLSHQN